MTLNRDNLRSFSADEPDESEAASVPASRPAGSAERDAFWLDHDPSTLALLGLGLTAPDLLKLPVTHPSADTKKPAAMAGARRGALRLDTQSAQTIEAWASKVAAGDPLRIGPLYMPSTPACKLPVELLETTGDSRSNDDQFPFGLIVHREFEPSFPAAFTQTGMVPLVVTTPLMAQLEYARTGEWCMAFPLAPQRTRIVVTKKCKIAGRSDAQVSSKLGGLAIGVGDVTSTHACRLVRAAERGGLSVKLVAGAPSSSQRQSGVLYVVQMDFTEMVKELVKKKIDGFASVEPLPTIARFNLPLDYAEATLSDESPSTEVAHCCCVALPAPIVVDPRFAVLYATIAEKVFRASFEDLTAHTARIRSRLRDVVSAASPSPLLDVREAASEATLKSVLDHRSTILRISGSSYFGAKQMREALVQSLSSVGDLLRQAGRVPGSDEDITTVLYNEAALAEVERKVLRDAGIITTSSKPGTGGAMLRKSGS